MRSLSRLFVAPAAVAALAIFPGCYTEFATEEFNDDAGYYTAPDSSDTTVTDNDVSITNNYYLDDAYRQSRFRLSFNYFYPTYHSSWIAGYYYSYYNDPYWGFSYRSPWYYDPWSYGCVYPPYVYDPWWYYGYPTYYPWNHYYYHHPYVVYNSPPAAPGRVRSSGSSRDVTPENGRTRQPIAPPSTTVASSPRTRETTASPNVSTRPGRSRTETPWWERVNTTRTRSTDRSGSGSTSAVPTERKRERGTVSTPPSNAPKQQARPADRKRGTSKAAPPAGRRSRGSSSYSPPSSPQPSYTPAPSGGSSRSHGSSGSGSTGRRRN